jgi:hypothetical protein
MYAAGVATEVVKVAVGGRHDCYVGIDTRATCSAQSDWMCRVGLEVLLRCGRGSGCAEDSRCSYSRSLKQSRTVVVGCADCRVRMLAAGSRSDRSVRARYYTDGTAALSNRSEALGSPW